ncbi:class I SAM-dependent methyltransferase [Actinokineospora xionganensis]|uniref:Class I SAM-dependent methyltransferase n=1 Tax=Actinokineospora xionganensis TaxID=2684470 RepID=A0ABR7L2G9_9PSEU|nr:class I SAM-dependent methyltransferase [Actinokineospora xionganensis]MBC6446875.1 class I SAM-dependent methyltransferase [Actinokineospora xionganensis]
MLDKLRARTEDVKRSLRAKLMNAVEEAVGRGQAREIESLRAEVAGLRAELREHADRTVERVAERISDFEHRARRDLLYAAEREAAADSSGFATENLTGAEQFRHPHRTLEHALSLAPSGGLALEFGVFTGTTLRIIAAARGGVGVFGFDSFEGLPADWRAGYPAGAFATDGLPDVPGADLVVGWFDDTLPGFLAEHPGPVDFLHVDADLYSSAKTVLDLVGPRLRAGSVVVFDEFFNYAGWREHEFKAWQEYVADTATEFEYAAYTIDNEQVVVRVTTTDSPPG